MAEMEESEATDRRDLDVHGSLSDAERAQFPAGWIDLAVNTNPYGPHASVVDAVHEAVIGVYPDASAAGLTVAWETALELKRGQLLFANGGVELIWAACRAFLCDDLALLVIGPTFTEAERYARRFGVPVVRVDATAATDWRPIPHEIERAVAAVPHGIGLAYICSPNNPTGVALKEGAIADLARAAGAPQVLVDESFATVSRTAARQTGSLPATPGARDLYGATLTSRTLRVRSLTKDFAIPGVRLGYVTGDATDVARCAAQIPPWNVSAPAAAAGHAILREPARRFLASTRTRWAEDAEALDEALHDRGFATAGSDAPFALVRVGDANGTRSALAAVGVHVRDCASFGLPEFIRVAARPAMVRERFFRALDEAITGDMGQRTVR